MTADLVVRAAKVYTMDPALPVAAGLAIQGGQIVAVARDAAELDEQTGPDTTVLGGEDPGDLVVLPAFIDTHNHLMLSAHNVLGVPVSRAENIEQMIALSASAPPGRPKESGSSQRPTGTRTAWRNVGCPPRSSWTARHHSTPSCSCAAATTAC